MSYIDIKTASELYDMPQGTFLNKTTHLYKTIVYIDGQPRVDVKKLEQYIEAKKKKQALSYEMCNLAEFIIAQIGTERFYKPFDQYRKYEIMDGLKKDLLKPTHAQKIWEIYGEEWLPKMEAFYGDFVPPLERKPLTKEYLKANYWDKKMLPKDIAFKLNVPESWVYAEIRRLKMSKKANGIKIKGRKGWVADQAYKKARQNQPHRRACVCIDPKTFETIKEYRSFAAVSEDGYSREHVRRAIKQAGLHGGYLWSEKGMEKIIIKIAKERGNLDLKLRMRTYKQPSKSELELYYIKLDMTLDECARHFGCHRFTIAALAGKYSLRKRTGKITKDTLIKLFVDEGLTASQIAEKTGYKASSISTYLSRYGIKKRDYRMKNAS